MSFYVYYGKLGKDLVVAILPNGTIEVDDKLYLSSENGIFSYRARTVALTEDGEDRVTFADSLASYVAVSKQGYKELSITRTSKNEKVTATLTRKYDQPQSALSSTSKPRIWFGRLNFHDWAKNEEIVLVAPKGIGSKKPIVSVWQWTEDKNKEKGVICHAVSEQESNATTPNSFSFKQNGFYTVTCKFDAISEALGLKLKGPADSGPLNAEVEQKNLVSAKVDLGAEARFTPPRAIQTKKELECSHPAAKPNIARVNKELPFPAGLIETLQHTAAYLDHAGGLAKYANKQFDKVYERNEQLEKKVQIRDQTISELNGKVKTLEDDKKSLTIENEGLKKEIIKVRETAEAEEKKLQDELKKVTALLLASQLREKSQAEEIKRLNGLIAKDAKDDQKREQDWQKHHEEDMKAYQLLEDQFTEAKEQIRNLKKELHESNEKSKARKARLIIVEARLAEAEAEIRCLVADVDFERSEKKKLEAKLKDVTKKLELALRDLEYVRNENAGLKREVETATKKVKDLTTEKDELQKKLAAAEHEFQKTLKELNGKLSQALDDLKESEDEAARQEKKVETRDIELVRKEKECEDLEAQIGKKNAELAEKHAELLRKDEAKDAIENSLKKEIADQEIVIKRLKDKKSPATANIVEITKVA